MMVGIAKHATIAGLLVTLLGLSACGEGEQENRRTAQRPTVHAVEVSEDMDTAKALIVGVVQDADGKPVSGATVYVDDYFRPLGEDDFGGDSLLQVAVQDEDGTWKWQTHDSPKLAPRRTTSDAHGRYAFADDEALRKSLRDNSVKLWAEHGEQVASKVLLRASEYPARAAMLNLGPTLRPQVQLVDRHGHAIVDAFVSMDLRVENEFGNSIPDLMYSMGARSNDRGIARLPAVPDRPDWQMWLRVNATERPQYLDMDYPLSQLRSPDPVRVELPAGCTVRGRVELPDGAVGNGVSVAASHDPLDPNPGGANITLTHKDGTFELRGVPTKAVLKFTELVADATEESLFLQNTEGARLIRRVTGAEGETIDLGVVRLPAAESIAGVVLDKDGKPATRGHVMLDVRSAPAGPNSSSPIGPDGSFELGSLEPGRHTIVATIFGTAAGQGNPFRSGLKAQLKDVPAGSRDVVIRVTGGGNLIVRFHPAGKPDVLLEVWSPSICWDHYGSGHGSKSTEIRAMFEPGARSDLRIEAEGYKPKMLGPIDILPDRATVIDVELEPADTDK